ncbi:outer membrane protein assembly factor BamD [Candidatus Pelagibacter sp. Uisw_130]|uniref:outer membrane protein assembly factor BamD n=1 Tax=Candidatus Pelagibacter sp. Uisw_130 TaxID=3230989 RepID=UPI0039E7362F
MKFIIKLSLVFLITFALYSCSKPKENISLIKEITQEEELITTYKKALDSLNKGDPYYASKKFLETEMLFPQSDWAPKSALMAAYSYYVQDYYAESIFHLERYLNTYPNDTRVSYGHFLLAMSHYQKIVGEKNDLKPLMEARDKFQFIIETYPNTDFAVDSKFKIDLINEIMASKEMYIARHYVKKKKWIAAINRFKTIIEDYETTIYVEESIHRLVEIYYYLGLLEESKKYASFLGYNYGSSQWYQASYKLFNKDYEKKIVKLDKKEKKGIIKKFKKLFE